jgi:hypothetical protein
MTGQHPTPLERDRIAVLSLGRLQRFGSAFRADGRPTRSESHLGNGVEGGQIVVRVHDADGNRLRRRCGFECFGVQSHQWMPHDVHTAVGSSRAHLRRELVDPFERLGLSELALPTPNRPHRLCVDARPAG